MEDNIEMNNDIVNNFGSINSIIDGNNDNEGNYNYNF